MQKSVPAKIRWNGQGSDIIYQHYSQPSTELLLEICPDDADILDAV